MADGFIVRRGGGVTEQALAPTITEVSVTDSSITFTVTNNDAETATIAFRVSSVTASGQTISLASNTTSSNITVSGLDDDTTFTVFATANVTGKVKSEVAEKEITTDKTFDPADLSPQIWLDAADATTITQSSGKVSQWTNKGSLSNFTNGSSATQPVTNVSTLNSLNVIDFDLEFLTATNRADYTFMHNGTEYEVFHVAKFGVSNETNTVYGIFGSSLGDTSANIGVADLFENRTGIVSNGYRTLISGISNQVPVNNISGANFAQAGVYNIISSHTRPSISPVSERSILRNANANQQKNNIATGTVSTSQSTFNLQIGALGNNATRMKGSIAELIVISGANVTTQNRTDIINYLSNKWGISI